ncbi:neprilysin-1-like [Physella acuta]|uniref:neprilysin-1-like n=1 Tax=Physella acuta TaxID=109671 RepID=UPI0027DD72AC|nr:neprilysin-1-like [Physella acuta]
MKLKAARTIKVKMDLNVDPCEDFYRYSCGGWLDNVQVPDDSFMIGSFSTIDRDSTSKLKDMLSNETRASDPLYEAVPKTFYAACVNTDLIDERGAKPFLDLISTVGGFPVINSLWSESDFNMEDLVIKLHELGLTPFMSLYVDADKGQKKTFILDFPYYVVSDRNESSNREFVMEALRLLGANEDVLNRDFEEMNAVKLAVLQALYNSSATVAYPISIDQLQEKYKWVEDIFSTLHF